jgi:N-acetylmuramoyl-L-alanine amidase
MLENTGRYRVLLTRERVTLIPCAIAWSSRERRGRTCHFAATDSIRPRPSGAFGVFALGKASDREAAELADSENQADLIAGVDLSKETPEVPTS